MKVMLTKAAAAILLAGTLAIKPTPAHADHVDFCTGQAMNECEAQYGTDGYFQCANTAYISCVNDNPDMYPSGSDAHGFGPDYWEKLHFCDGRLTCNSNG